MRDMIDPRLITVLEPCTDGGVLGWPMTSQITRAGRQGRQIWFEHSKATSWPATDQVFGQGTAIQGNPCIVAQVNGKWYAAGFDWLGVARQDKELDDWEFGRDQIRVGPMDAMWMGPKPGDIVGVFVTTPSSLRIAARTVNERSNIVTFVWPSPGERAEYVLEEDPVAPVVQTSSLDPTYLRAAVRASFLGVLHREPSQSEWDYFVDKASKPELFSDGVTRIGWNAYWEVRVDPAVASADPKLGDQPARFQPGTPQPQPDPEVPTDTQTAIYQAKVLELLASINAELRAQRTEVVAAVKEAGGFLSKIKWPFLLLLVLVAGPVFAQAPVFLNPAGVVVFDSPDHAKAASYELGWFLVADQVKPASTQTIAATAVTGTGPYTATFTTRPSFRLYVMKLRMIAAAPCDPGMCESPWSDAATWSTTATPPATGTNVGYTPQNPRGFILQK